MSDNSDNLVELNIFSNMSEPIINQGSISALEMLLSYTSSKEEARRLTVKLLNACGSFSAVLDAPYSVLNEQGLSTNQSVLIKIIPAITRKYLDSKYFSKTAPAKISDFKTKIITAFIGSATEEVLLVLRDRFDTELYFGMVSKGSVNASEIYIKKIIELALRFKASSAVIAHNHPSGVSYPSQKDSESTIKIKNALNNVNVILKNHYIVAANNAFSMADSEEFFDLFL